MDQWAGSSVNLLVDSELVLFDVIRTWKRPKDQQRQRSPSNSLCRTRTLVTTTRRSAPSWTDSHACFCLCVDQVDQAIISVGSTETRDVAGVREVPPARTAQCDFGSRTIAGTLGRPSAALGKRRAAKGGRRISHGGPKGESGTDTRRSCHARSSSDAFCSSRADSGARVVKQHASGPGLWGGLLHGGCGGPASLGSPVCAWDRPSLRRARDASLDAKRKALPVCCHNERMVER